jgi:hypothetical protein
MTQRKETWKMKLLMIQFYDVRSLENKGSRQIEVIEIHFVRSVARSYTTKSENKVMRPQMSNISNRISV